MKIVSELFLFFSTESCWKCGKNQPVIALGSSCIEDPDIGIMGSANNIEDIFLLSHISEMPKYLYEKIYELHPKYKKHYSETAEMTYFSNMCECGANFGDYYLFSQPGGAFFPLSFEDVPKIEFCRLFYKEPLNIEASWSSGQGKHIYDNGTERTIGQIVH